MRLAGRDERCERQAEHEPHGGHEGDDHRTDSHRRPVKAWHDEWDAGGAADTEDHQVDDDGDGGGDCSNLPPQT
jgi:hypothetical protein